MNNEISQLLLHPTPANLKQECIHVCEERFIKKDEKALRAFFGPADSQKKFMNLIENIPIDKFRPLVKYLKEETETTDNRNLEILAWLIDFKHRPFEFAKEVELNEEELVLIGKKVQVNEPEEIERVVNGVDFQEGNIDVNHETNRYISEPKDEESSSLLPAFGEVEKKGRRSRELAGTMSFLILLIFMATLYNFLGPDVKDRCMFWTGDHYESVSCDQSTHDAIKLPLDEMRLKTFRKILREDTITEYSIGKIYYIKNAGQIEYYTGSGHHPVEVNRNVKVLSKYMFEKYLRKK